MYFRKWGIFVSHPHIWTDGLSSLYSVCNVSLKIIACCEKCQTNAICECWNGDNFPWYCNSYAFSHGFLLNASAIWSFLLTIILLFINKHLHYLLLICYISVLNFLVSRRVCIMHAYIYVVVEFFIIFLMRHWKLSGFVKLNLIALLKCKV